MNKRVAHSNGHKISWRTILEDVLRKSPSAFLCTTSSCPETFKKQWASLNLLCPKTSSCRSNDITYRKKLISELHITNSVKPPSIKKVNIIRSNVNDLSTISKIKNYRVHIFVQITSNVPRPAISIFDSSTDWIRYACHLCPQNGARHASW